MKGFSIPGGGRTLALVILVLAASISFVLGYYVGKSSAPTRTVVKEVRVPAPAPRAVPASGPSYNQEVEIEKSPVMRDSLEVATVPRPAPPRRVKTGAKLVVLPNPVTTPESPKSAETTKKTGPTPDRKTASSRDRFSVQVGAFETLKDAETLRKKFDAKGYDSFVLRDGAAGKKTVFKVRVGEFIDRDAARLLAVKLKSIEDISAFVVQSN